MFKGLKHLVVVMMVAALGTPAHAAGSKAIAKKPPRATTQLQKTQKVGNGQKRPAATQKLQKRVARR